MATQRRRLDETSNFNYHGKIILRFKEKFRTRSWFDNDKNFQKMGCQTMVVKRKARREITIRETEEILKDFDELALCSLTYLLNKKVRFQLNSQQVALFIRNHPTIKRVGKRSKSVYTLVDSDL